MTDIFHAAAEQDDRCETQRYGCVHDVDRVVVRDPLPVLGEESQEFDLDPHRAPRRVRIRNHLLAPTMAVAVVLEDVNEAGAGEHPLDGVSERLVLQAVEGGAEPERAFGHGSADVRKQLQGGEERSGGNEAGSKAPLNCCRIGIAKEPKGADTVEEGADLPVGLAAVLPDLEDVQDREHQRAAIAERLEEVVTARRILGDLPDSPVVQVHERWAQSELHVAARESGNHRGIAPEYAPRGSVFDPAAGRRLRSASLLAGPPRTVPFQGQEVVPWLDLAWAAEMAALTLRKSER